MKSLNNKKHIKIRLLLYFLSYFMLVDSFSQTPISLAAAIDLALKNNLSIRNEKIKAEYQKSLISTAKVIPVSTINAEVGQINSAYFDSKFSLGQSLNFPKVYQSQKNFYEEVWKNSQLAVAVSEHELKKQVSKSYYQIAYLEQKYNLLLASDSLYSAFLRRADLRLVKGESNILEKISAENQLGLIKIQLKQLEADKKTELIHFQYLLNSSSIFIPNELTPKALLMTNIDLKEHPTAKFLWQQQQIADATIAVEKSKLMPTLSFNYSNGSIRGIGADDKFYNAFHRFQSLGVGIGIPIFKSALRAKINSEKVNKMLAESNYEWGLQTLSNEYKMALATYEKYIGSKNYFERIALTNAKKIEETAQNQLINGDINYLEWAMLVNQAINIRNEYIDALHNLNQSILQLNSLSNLY